MNEVSIVVKSKDDSGRGLASARAKVRSAMRGMTEDVDRESSRQRGILTRAFSSLDFNAGGSIFGSLKSALMAGVKPVAAAAAGTFAAQFAAQAAVGLASGAAKIAQGLGAAIALAPAAALAGVAAMASLKLAVAGVGDALSAGLSGDVEKFEESLEGLAPPARTFAREVAGLKGSMDGLRTTVQAHFFRPLIGQVEGLNNAYLPALQGNLSLIAQSFGEALRSTSGFLQLPPVAAALGGALTNARLAISNVAAGLPALVAAFVPLVSVGSTFLPSLTTGFSSLTERVALFMQNAERTGKLREFIQGGIDKVKELWETTKQLARIFVDLVGIGRKVFGALGLQSGGLLDAVERATDGFNRFLETARGSETLARVIGMVRQVMSNLVGTAMELVGALADAFGPILPQVGELLKSFAKLKVEVIAALEPVLQAVAAVLGGVVLPALTGLFNMMSENRVMIAALAGVIVALFTGWAISAGAAAVATLLAAAPLILLGAAVGALAALFIIHWNTIKNAISAVFDWVANNWPTLLVILTGPIGIAVLLIVNHWNTIKNAAMAVFRWVQSNWPLLLAILTGPIGIAVLLIVNHWNKIRAVASVVWNFIRGLVAGVAGGIVGSIQWAAGVIGGAIATGSSIASAAIGWIGDAIRAVKGVIGDAVNWIQDKIASVANAVSGLMDAAGSVIGAIPGLAHGGIAGAASGKVGSGWTMVGEHGRELVRLPAGARVHQNNKTEQMLAGVAGGGGVNLTVNVHGSVLSERELVRVIRDEALNGGFRGAFS